MKILGVVGAVVLLLAAYLGYRYWQIRELAQKYSNAKEIASAQIEKNGSTWNIHIESVIADPIDDVWKSLKQAERFAELQPSSFKRSTLVKEEGNKKTLELEVVLLSLPSQQMVAEMTFDDSAHRAEISTSKGLQDLNGVYQLTALAPDRTLLSFIGTAVERVSLPLPSQSILEGAFRELFVVQVRAVQVALHGKGKEAVAGTTIGAGKFCAGPAGPDATRQVTITVVGPSGAPAAAGPAEFQNDLPNGYERGYLANGVPVREVYSRDTSCTTATADIDGKLAIQVQSVLVSPSGLEGWVKNVDMKKLAALGHGADAAALTSTFPPPLRGWQVVPPTAPANLPSPLAYQMYEQALF